MSSIESRLSSLEQQPLEPAAQDGSILPPVKHVGEFVTSKQFLGVDLYPVQLLLVKMCTLAIELFTPWDYALLDKWSAGYTRVEDPRGARFDGTSGTTPDVLERIKWCLLQGRSTFNEIVMVMGRRAGKSLITAILLTWEVWKLLAMGDPQAALHLPAGKKIGVLIFGTTRENAIRDLFGDVRALIEGALCFAPYIEHVSQHMIRLYTPAQIANGARSRREHGQIVIIASPTVPTAGRGLALKFMAIDEVAYVDTGTTPVASQLYTAATPAMMQFKGHACVVLPSTPASKAGLLYEQVRQATLIDTFTGKSQFPDRLLIHLPSWATYEGWQDAHLQPMWPVGPPFPKFHEAKMEQGERLDNYRLANPESFVTEIEAQWQSIRDAYFKEETVQRIFGPYQNRPLTQQACGQPKLVYFAHCDPSVSGANFALTVGHTEQLEGERHIVTDLIRVWRPRDFLNHVINYIEIEKELLSVIERFRLKSLTFDKYNSSFLIDRLREKTRKLGIGTQIRSVDTTHDNKFERYELLKTLANQGLVHAPPHDLAEDETRFLKISGTTIGHPTTGPVTTDDCIDAISHLVTQLAGANPSAHQQLSDLRLHASPFPRNPAAHLFEEISRTGAKRRLMQQISYDLHMNTRR